MPRFLAMSCLPPAFLALVVCSLLPLAPAPASAAWPAGNDLVASEHLDRVRPQSVSDGVGGQIIVWEETYRGSSNLFAQRLDATGAPQWGNGGVVICGATGNQSFPALCADGAGGAIVAWQDYRSGATSNIYAQRIAATGAMSWTANGVAVCTALNSQAFPVIAPDGSGGAIVSWWDGRGADWDIYGRRVNSSGTPQWTADGVALCAVAGNQINAAMVSDGSGGAIVAWADSRGASSDIYAQRISGAGAIGWTANGVGLCAATGDQTQPAIAIDGSGGAIVTWVDLRAGTNTDIYARRISSAGSPQGIANGVAICTVAGDQNGCRVESDGVGGAFIAWTDVRGSDSDIYTQRVDASLFSQWTLDGVAVCTQAGSQSSPRIDRDGSGGCFATWIDNRSGGTDLYAQRSNAGGVPQWTAGGVAVTVALDTQVSPSLAADGSGGVVVVWQDHRSGTLYDIEAQRLDAGGNAQWKLDGTPVAPQTLVEQAFLTSASDAAGGMLLAWEESYAGNNDLYAQRVDGSGNVLWGADGVAVSRAAGQQGPARIVADGAGGAVLAWPDDRSGTSDMYAQRLDATGVAQWTADGVAVCVAVGSQDNLVTTSDGAGGAILAWHDARPSGDGDIFAQRVTFAGAPLWTTNGVGICTATNPQTLPSICSDGAGGAIIAWEDQRAVNSDIYARRITAAGVPQWTLNGVALCTDPGIQQYSDAVPDGAGGAIVTWSDRRSGTHGDIYARRVTSAGAVLWAANGVAISTATSEKYGIEAAADGAGGALIGWTDTRATFWDVYAQLVNSSGATQWTADGAPIATASGNQSLSGVVSDGAGGAYFTWSSDQNGLTDIYVQRTSAAGASMYASGGVLVSAAPGNQGFLNLVTDGAGGAIAAWQDNRNGTDADIYANRVIATGPVAVPETHAAPERVWLVAAGPSPMREATTLRFALPRATHVSIALFDAQGRHVRTLLERDAVPGEQRVTWDGRDDAGRTVVSAVYFARLEGGGEARTVRLVKVE